MRAGSASVCLLLTLSAAACTDWGSGYSSEPFVSSGVVPLADTATRARPQPDAEPSDTGTLDTGTPDAGPADTGTPDTGTPDAGPVDTGTPDTGTPDSGPVDTGTPDNGPVDAGTPDTGTPDTGTPDTGAADTGTPDTTQPDTAQPDTAQPDTTQPDVIGGPEQCNLKDDNGDGRVDEGCLPPPNLRPDQQWIDLGAFEVVAGAPVGPKITAALATASRAVVWVRRRAGPTAYTWLDRLEPPTGPLWVSPDLYTSSPMRSPVAIDASAFLFGSNPAYPLQAGAFTLGAHRSLKLPWAGTTPGRAGWLQVGLVTSAPLPGKGATLDLDIHTVGGHPMPAAKLAKDPIWQQVLGLVETIWDTAGLSLGKVTYTDVGGAAGQLCEDVDNILSSGPDNELADCLALGGATQGKSTAVQVYLVASINADGKPLAAGLTGSLPGIPGVPGGRAGGVLIAAGKVRWAQSLTLDPSGGVLVGQLAATLAHELGHHLGLWHTDERSGVLQDTVPDTPHCPVPPGKGELSADDCPKGKGYLMFWSPKGTSVSPGQVTVVRRHPAIRP